MLEWPDNKKFAFTVIDDTENGTVENLKPVYDFLHDCGIHTTKTVWVYPPRDNFVGQCLEDIEYREFVLNLKNKGFEIGLHNVGSGSFTRQEILEGLKKFYEIIGYNPKVHINHSMNKDNMYWGYKRFGSILSLLMKWRYGLKRTYYGDEENSPHFWGDFCKQHIKYIRNHTFNGTNTYGYDSEMPYRVKSKEKYSNYWFSASNGPTVTDFNKLVNPKTIDTLEECGGICIVYTYFSNGFYRDNKLDEEFKQSMLYLAKKRGLYVPAGELLDYILARKQKNNYASLFYQNKLDFMWLKDKLFKTS